MFVWNLISLNPEEYPLDETDLLTSFLTDLIIMAHLNWSTLLDLDIPNSKNADF